MKETRAYTVEELLPHSGPMLLIDELVDWGEDFVEVLVTHQHPNIFSDAQGRVPGWVGIEYMAQAIGIFAGLKSKAKGESIKVGFLLGTRKYLSHLDCFAAQQAVSIRAQVLMYDEHDLAVFDCSIISEHTVLASAQIKAIQPKDSEAVIELLSS